ncbi:MAG: CsbD family protein [Pseudonocardiales bacterium]|nr:MAG: CsbD family protein [Pseudonocardiales bacterium]
MGAEDKMKNKAQTMKGTAKEKLGDATDDESMQAEGQADKTAGNLKQAGEKIKDAFKS